MASLPSSSARIRDASAQSWPSPRASCSRTTAAPASSSARALARWCPPAAAGKGTSRAGTPAAASSETNMAPARPTARSARSSWRPRASIHGVTRMRSAKGSRPTRSRTSPRCSRPVTQTRVRSVGQARTSRRSAASRSLRPRAPWLPPTTSATRPSPGQSKVAGPPGGATGLPKAWTSASGRTDSPSRASGKPRWSWSAAPAIQRVTRPGAAFCSWSARGRPASRAQSTMGPEA